MTSRAIATPAPSAAAQAATVGFNPESRVFNYRRKASEALHGTQRRWTPAVAFVAVRCRRRGGGRCASNSVKMLLCQFARRDGAGSAPL